MATLFTSSVQWLVVAYTAVLCPSRCTAYLDHSRRVRLAVLGGLVLALGGGTVALGGVLMWYLPFPAVVVAAAVLFALVVAVCLPVPLHFGFALLLSSGGRWSHTLHLSVLRTGLVVVLPATLLIVLLLAFQQQSWVGWLWAVGALLCGLWLGDIIAVALVNTTQLPTAARLRWLGVVCGVVTLAAAWLLIPPTDVAARLLAIGGSLGLILGLTHLFIWVLAVPWCLALLGGAQGGGHPAQLLRWHPVVFDELSIIPYPGLTTLLVQAWQHDPARGGTWLLTVAAHHGQSQAAVHAVRHILSQGDAGLALTEWLTQHPAGMRWLQSLATRTDLPALAHAVVAFSMVDDAGLWRPTIARYAQLLARRGSAPDGFLCLLTTAHAMLSADEWHDMPRSVTVPSAAPRDTLPVWHALTHLMVITDTVAPTLHTVTQLEHWAGQYPRAVQGWQGALLAAVGLHTQILCHIECQRMAWKSGERQTNHGTLTRLHPLPAADRPGATPD